PLRGRVRVGGVLSLRAQRSNLDFGSEEGGGIKWRRKKWSPCAFKVLAQQLAKRMGWAMPAQDFAGPVVEHRLHLLDVLSRELIEPRPLGEKLAQQAIGVLIRAPLPGTMRVCEVHLN